MPLQIVRNDITRMRVDAIVNAANNSLLGGGGVDGAIHRAAGPGLLAECRTLGGCETGQAKITKGYNLPCRYVIHTVGPIWRGGHRGEPELLASCYRNSLALAKAHDCESVAFPLISAGVYGYPKAEALRIAVNEITRFLQDSDMTVTIVVFTMNDFQVSGSLFSDIRSYIDDVYVDAHFDARRESARARGIESNAPMSLGDMAFSDAALPTMSLNEMLSQMDEGFSQALLRLIDERGLTDAQCYKRANVDRRLFNKIKNTPGYRPGKQTVLAFAIALKLDLDETRDLLAKAGYALSHSSRSDIAVEYCILNGIYDIIRINEVLFKLDLQPLGY